MTTLVPLRECTYDGQVRHGGREEGWCAGDGTGPAKAGCARSDGGYRCGLPDRGNSSGDIGPSLGYHRREAGDTTTTKSWPSETLITSLLAIGAVLVIVGFLWARITSIKVAGAEIGLSDDEKEKVANALTEKVPEGANPEEAAKAALSAVSALTEQKATGAALTDADISTMVEQHTQDLQPAG